MVDDAWRRKRGWQKYKTAEREREKKLQWQENHGVGPTTYSGNGGFWGFGLVRDAPDGSVLAPADYHPGARAPTTNLWPSSSIILTILPGEK